MENVFGRTFQSISSVTPKLPHEFLVGQILASSLKKLSALHGDVFTEGSDRTVSPHWRRAHWHTYWKGEGRTKRVVHWLPPIPVNVGDGDRLPVIERNVKSDSAEEEGLTLDRSFFYPTDDNIH